jgi:hypothetical protein
VVCTPDPHVVHDDVVRVDRDAIHGCGGRSRAADAAGDVEQGSWVGGVIDAAVRQPHDE